MMRRRPARAAIAAALLLAAPATAQVASVPSAVVDLTGEAAPAATGSPYAARNLPDRIVLTPGADPSRDMAVAWRTNMAQGQAEAELAELVPAPNFGSRATRITGLSTATTSENGPARYHQVRFTALKPDTAYAYRLKGAAGWSEWHQFRSAAAAEAPFRFLYLGDTQNSILTIGSLAIRRALLHAGNPAVMLHAGDLVASRDDMVHDDEWGEWTAAGGWAFASIPQIPAPGNHEYVDMILPGGKESRRLAPHWPLSFALPANGAPGAEATSYVVDYQGVRFVVLDGTSAIDLGTLDAQTRWLDARLAESRARWTIVLFHQPIYTCARPNDTPILKKAWVPLFDKHKVDLVLQGHDHCYSRLTSAQGREAGRKARNAASAMGGAVQGPVYIVSVAGAKMYGLNDRAMVQPDRVAEDTSLFQVVDVSPDRLSLRAHLNTGVLYDGFDLVRHKDGTNRLEELPQDLPTVRRCSGVHPARTGPDGLPCVAAPKD